MPRHKAKIDNNQREIVEALRTIGCSVDTLAAVGKGMPDLLVGKAGVNYLLEVKNPEFSKPTLTKDQVIWHRSWHGTCYVVSDVNEAIAAITGNGDHLKSSIT